MTRSDWGFFLGIFAFTFVNIVGRLVLAENKMVESTSWWTTFPLALLTQFIVMCAFGVFRKSKN